MRILGVFADSWLENRQVKGQPFKLRTGERYRDVFDPFIVPTFGGGPLASITHESVEEWY